MTRLEHIILRHLAFEESYSRKVLPFLKEDYFLEKSEKVLFQTIADFLEKYKTTPTYEALVISITEQTRFREDELQHILDLLSTLNEHRQDETNRDWLIAQTESFCQDKAVYNAVLESVAILEDKKGHRAKGEIPELLKKALGVSFDPHVGHDYIEQSDQRYEFYHKKEDRIPFDLDFFNRITGGGLPKKTLNVALGGTNVGKSLVMCHMTSACLSAGYNVLYITLEMAEERIAERIDANLLNLDLDTLKKISKADYERKFQSLRSRTHGKLIIKEYPTASASVLHFRSLINELQLKKSFRPDIIFVDYINICASSRVKPGATINSYTYIKCIAEELRGLAVEFAVPLVSATQTTRSGFANSDPDLTDTSESFGLPATADFMFALIVTEELQQLNQMMVKQLKNRYGDPTINKRFVIGVDRAKMKLYDVEHSAQQLSDSGKDDGDAQKKLNRYSGLIVS